MNQPNLPPAFENGEQAMRHASTEIAQIPPEQACVPDSLAGTSEALGKYGLGVTAELSLYDRPAVEQTASKRARTRPTIQEQTANPFSALIAVRAELRALETATKMAIAKERVIVSDLLAAGLSPAHITAAANLALAETETGHHAPHNEATTQVPKQETRHRSTQTEPIDLMEPAPYVPHMHEEVYDTRPEFFGRVGTVTGFYPSEKNPRMLYVRPIDFDGEHQAEWNARPCDVTPHPPVPPQST